MSNAKFVFNLMVGLLFLWVFFGVETMLAVMAVMWILGLVTMGVGYVVFELMD